MKVAPVRAALAARIGVNQILVHTGQHYDAFMSDIFFQQLGIPEPDFNLGVGSGSHAQQTAAIMIGLEPVILNEKPDLVLVYGDVNSTVAAALVCSKLLVPIGHVEAGLRSFDNTMPEEINRVLTDRVANLLFTPSIDGNQNLAREGVPKEKIHLVGNVMIDTLIHILPHAGHLSKHAPPPKSYVLATLHRPSNVDNKENFQKIIEIFKYQNKINPELDIVFPVHPRTLKMLNRFGFLKELHNINNLVMTEPLGYFDFLSLIINAKYVLTDSGGIQEETTYLKIPCLTLRENTERPITCELGTNTICGLNSSIIFREIKKINSGLYKKGSIPKLWDGNAAKRIVKIIMEHL